MLQSMTGFGRHETTLNDYILSVDIKTLNGKQLELSLRLPPAIKPFEIDIKNAVQTALQRGSIELNINVKKHGSTKPMQVNTELAKYYYEAIQQVSKAVNEPVHDAMAIVMTMPEVVAQNTDVFTDAEYATILQTVQTALINVNTVRTNEGKTLAQYLQNTIEKIQQLSDAVVPFETARIEKQRAKLQTLVAENINKVDLDNNRLEQEIIYYIEKIDITEEKIRLAHHCTYFLEQLNENTLLQKGKKLGFILQEIGREINTMGSKANDVNIQKLVVQMKDELEKAKEQTLNVL